MDCAAAAGRTISDPCAGESTVIRLKNALACSRCPARELGLCGGLDAVRSFCRSADAASSDDAFHRSPARSRIPHQEDAAENASIICRGWAVSVLALPDGRRQIVSVLLSGDPFPPTGLFEPEHGRSVEAVTNVIYRKFKLNEVKSLLHREPRLFFKISGFFMQERDASDQLALDLGRRNAEQRIARMILRLRDRLLRRGLADRTRMDFPLTRHQIADAAGLTPAHVSRVMKAFGDRNIVRAGDRSLILIDLAALMRIAEEPGAI